MQGHTGHKEVFGNHAARNKGSIILSKVTYTVEQAEARRHSQRRPDCWRRPHTALFPSPSELCLAHSDISEPSCIIGGWIGMNHPDLPGESQAPNVLGDLLVVSSCDLWMPLELNRDKISFAKYLGPPEQRQAQIHPTVVFWEQSFHATALSWIASVFSEAFWWEMNHETACTQEEKHLSLYDLWTAF